MRSRKNSESEDCSKTKKERFIKLWNRKADSSTMRRYHTRERGVLMKKEEIFLSKMQKLQDSLFHPNDNEIY
jgi:hypothetical protein